MRWSVVSKAMIVSWLTIKAAHAWEVGPGGMWPQWPMVDVPLAKVSVRMQIHQRARSIGNHQLRRFAKPQRIDR